MIFINENYELNLFLFTVMTWLKSLFCVQGNSPQNMSTEYIMPEILSLLKKHTMIEVEVLSEKLADIDIFS